MQVEEHQRVSGPIALRCTHQEYHTWAAVVDQMVDKLMTLTMAKPSKETGHSEQTGVATAHSVADALQREQVAPADGTAAATLSSRQGSADDNVCPAEIGAGWNAELTDDDTSLSSHAQGEQLPRARRKLCLVY